MNKKLIFIKFGGSVISDKSKPMSIKPETIESLTKELAAIRENNPALKIIVGNGAGSFGHYTAKKHLQKKNLSQSQESKGVAKVAASVRELNGIVTDALLQAEVSAVSVSPSSIMALTAEGHTVYTDPIRNLLSREIIPVVYGDILIRPSGGYKIFSTERVFSILMEQLRPNYDIESVIYVTDEEGVLDSKGRVVRRLDTAGIANHPQKGAHDDVTGGMHSKVQAALEAAKQADKVYIIGPKYGALKKAVNHQEVGTIVSSK